MTERLYYHDSFLREFDARVLACRAAGDRFEIMLDRTAFYPTSGGQPHDTGRLGEARVLEVADGAEHSVVHFTDCALPEGPVHGALDWGRRFDHMQQHTGQHILSAAFIELFKFPTVSFHLGRDAATIDLDAPSIVQRHIEEAEQLSNRVVFEDRPVAVRFGTAQELADVGIRKAVEREGVLRAIEIEGFDRQPCGGTHVTRTGQVGPILLRKVERQKQAWRVEFVCGLRALRVTRSDFNTLTEAGRILSCGLPDVPAIVRKIQEEQQALHRELRALTERLAEYEAARLLAAEPVTGGGRAQAKRAPALVTRIFEDASAEFLRILAAKLVVHHGVQALLATRSGGHVVFAQAPGGGADMGTLLREGLAAAGGKGGGGRDFAQGRLPDAARLEEVLHYGSTRLEQ
jgi:alanyl-tRNA synthetase